MSINWCSVVMGTQPVHACSVSMDVHFSQVVQTRNGNFILVHTVIMYTVRCAPVISSSQKVIFVGKI